MLTNDIKNTDRLPNVKIIGLCDSLLERMEEMEFKRLRRTDPDQYIRRLKSQFHELNDHYPGIFNMLTQYGRKMKGPGGADIDIMQRIRGMMGVNDQLRDGRLSRDDADKKVDYELAQEYVKPALPEGQFDTIVPNPEQRDNVRE